MASAKPNEKISKSCAQEAEETDSIPRSDLEYTDTTRLYIELSDNQWPIVYTSDYNIGFLGLQKLHPFDSGKWGRVFEFLKEAKLLDEKSVVKPSEVTVDELEVVHTKRYLNSLQWSVVVASICEVPPVALLPNFIVQRKLLKPLRTQTGGTIMAGKMALDRGWSINIGGGFHHCSSDNGGGFCAYADITLSIKFLFKHVDGVSKAMIIDLDAHQGNGHEADFMGDDRVYIMDVYNTYIYPRDHRVKGSIRKNIQLNHFTSDEQYLPLLRRHIPEALEEFHPDIVVYNAGTDILIGDPLGNLAISPEGIIERDRIVFQECRQRGIPVLMVTSGGYQKSTARVIADSILNLNKLKLIGLNKGSQVPPQSVLAIQETAEYRTSKKITSRQV